MGNGVGPGGGGLLAFVKVNDKFLLANGDIIMLADRFISRLTSEGIVDAAFGDNGSVIDYGRSLSALSLRTDGKIIVGGYIGGTSLARYFNDGTLDITFGDNGILLTDFLAISSLILQPDNKIIISGAVAGYSALARHLPDGLLDQQFGTKDDTVTRQWVINEQATVVLGPNAKIFDNELAGLGNYDGATLTLVRQGGAQTEDEFSAKAGGTLTALTPGSSFSVNGVITGQVLANAGGTLQLRFLNPNATQARVDLAMQQIAYTNTSDAPPASVRINWTFNDGNTGTQGTGGALSTTGTVTVNINPVNDPPVVATPPASQTAIIGNAFT